MRHFILTSIAAGAVLLVGCGGGSSGSSMQGPTGPVATVPVTPVTPTPTPDPTPVPTPDPVLTKPEFTAYVAKMAIAAESDEPAVMDDIEFTFSDEEDDTAFAAVLEAQ